MEKLISFFKFLNLFVLFFILLAICHILTDFSSYIMSFSDKNLYVWSLIFG